MGLRGRLRNLKQVAEKDLMVIPLHDVSTARFHEDAFMECFVHESGRGRAHHFGDPVPPAHPLGDALREAEDLEKIAKKHGTILAMWVGEDEIIRGRSSARELPSRIHQRGQVTSANRRNGFTATSPVEFYDIEVAS